MSTELKPSPKPTVRVDEVLYLQHQFCQFLGGQQEMGCRIDFPRTCSSQTVIYTLELKNGSVLSLWVKSEKKKHLLLKKKPKELHYMSHLMSSSSKSKFQERIESTKFCYLEATCQFQDTDRWTETPLKRFVTKSCKYCNLFLFLIGNQIYVYMIFLYVCNLK